MYFKKFRFPALIGMTVLYNWFFWQEKLGLNLLLFSSLLIGLVLLFNQPSLRSKTVWITAAGTLLTGILVIFYNSGIAKVAHIASFFTFAGFASVPQLRSVIGALLTQLQNWATGFGEIGRSIKNIQPKSAGAKKSWSVAKLSVIPAMVLFIFGVIFNYANPKFAELTDNMGEWIGQAFENLFLHFSFPRFLFALSGAVILVGIIFAGKVKNMLKWDQSSEDVERTRKKLNVRTMGLRGLTQYLKKENRMGVILLGMVNALLLVVNYLDISWIWFNFEVEAGMNLSQFVHEGTYLLILSILLSMGIMLWFFRGNQNFYSQNKWLKWGSYAWIAQNAILTISVALRNYHYIDYHGLAYKRIGVIFFLALVGFGLVTLFWKIYKGKSGFFLWKINAWAVYAVMIVLTLFNWDMVIAKHNLSHGEDKEIDTPFLLTLSDKALPLLEEKREIFEGEYLYDSRITMSSEVAELNYRIRKFMSDYESQSWLSWNLPDQRAYDYFKSREANGAWKLEDS